MFSIHLGKGDGSQGMLTFGGYDLDKYARSGLTKNDIFWGKTQQNEDYWTLPLESIQIGDLMLEKWNRRVIFDSGVSYTLVPVEDYKTLI